MKTTEIMAAMSAAALLRTSAENVQDVIDAIASLTAPTVQAPVQTAADLSPNWVGEFDTFDDWVRRAQRVLSVPSHHAPAVCVDAKGRRCFIGKDMARARDEGAFPVRYFWDCEAGQQVAQGGDECAHDFGKAGISCPECGEIVQVAQGEKGSE